VTTDVLKPKQDRSRKTLELLLAATIRCLEQEGLEGCTLPRIAKAAEVSAASVYRRFEDKDALLRAAFLHVLQQSNSSNKAHLEQALLRPTLEATVERLVALLLKQYRDHPRLLRSLSKFLEVHSGSEFSRQALALIAGNLQLIAEVLLHHRDRIRHPDPPQAVVFAVLNAASSIEAVVFDAESLWHTALPLSDRQLSTELARSMLAYLRRKP
jgi:AcrR family transcriptional regulator